MEKEFIPYEQALALKELGFDEPCFGLYENGKLGYSFSTSQGIITPISYRTNSKFVEHILTKEDCTAPTFSQAFRWFREKHNMLANIYSNASGFLYEYHDTIGGTHRYDSGFTGDCEDTGTFTSFEKAQIECLKELIETIKT